MKHLRRILIICSFCALLNAVKCFAMTETDLIKKDDGYYYKTYTVSQNENVENKVKENINTDEGKYNFISFEKEGGNESEEKEIKTSKKITLNTNNKNKIIETLGKEIDYAEDGFVGKYILDEENLKITTNYNGFREDLIEETINYTNLERNDLDFIKKQITKNGLTLDLLNVKWEVESTKKIGEYDVGDKYTAICYYAGKQRIDYPNTYTINANYYGTAIKEIEKPTVYTIKYKFVENEKQVEEKKEVNVMPIVGGTGMIIVFLILLGKNVTVYNLKDGEFKKVGRVRIGKNNTIKLDRFAILEKTNKYKLVFSKGATKKVRGKMITVKKNTNTIKLLANTNNEIYEVEVRV